MSYHMSKNREKCIYTVKTYDITSDIKQFTGSRPPELMANFICRFVLVISLTLQKYNPEFFVMAGFLHNYLSLYLFLCTWNRYGKIHNNSKYLLVGKRDNACQMASCRGKEER